MKFGSILPWERDVDIAFSSAHMSRLEQRTKTWSQDGLLWVAGEVMCELRWVTDEIVRTPLGDSAMTWISDARLVLTNYKVTHISKDD